MNRPLKINYIKWFLIALLFKSLQFSYYSFIHNHYPTERKIVNLVCVDNNDFLDYVVPIENFVDHGEYSAPVSNGNKTFAFRLPGLLPVYGPLYFLFGRDIASTVFIFINLFSDALTVLLIGLIGFKLFKRIRYFYFPFFLYLISGFVSVYNSYVITESLSTCLLVSSIFFFIRYFQDGLKKFLFLSGILIAWTFFLRPATIIFFPVFILFTGVKVLETEHRLLEKMLAWLKLSLIFMISFIIIESTWIIRNYLQTEKFLPITSLRDDYAQHEIAMFSLIVTWGDDIQSWIPDSWAKWFVPPQHPNFDEAYSESNPFDPEVFTRDYNLDSLKELRKTYWFCYSAPNPAEKLKSENEVIKRTAFYKKSFNENAPMNYKIKGKIKLLKKYILVKQVYGSPFTKSDLFCKLNKLFLLGSYYLIIAGGMAGILLLVINKQPVVLFLAAFPILNILLHVSIGYIENRYLANVFPLLALFSGSFLVTIFERFTKKI